MRVPLASSKRMIFSVVCLHAHEFRLSPSPACQCQSLEWHDLRRHSLEVASHERLPLPSHHLAFFHNSISSLTARRALLLGFAFSRNAPLLMNIAIWMLVPCGPAITCTSLAHPFLRRVPLCLTRAQRRSHSITAISRLVAPIHLPRTPQSHSRYRSITASAYRAQASSSRSKRIQDHLRSSQAG